ncbi:helix-turn-helix transcriptional regulator [Bifidobacterium choerinum]|uniref:HTH cro/C1-type domain-containing protein n=1 Tax=Bifidobacterium choerinum TaxID=35760 RepID=A0A2D3D4M1_9BIFI|nr:helix-turn-helix transcriptional regulator [Bifidobacterium choerinum]ATU20099.1 hypothetical protein BcFMB_03165 [Bifidobacterium choerinum]
MDQKHIGTFLRELRLEHSRTQQQLADQIGVSNRSVSRWETRSTMPDLSLLVLLSEIYGISVDEILDGEGKGDEMIDNTTMGKVADYNAQINERRNHRMTVLFSLAFVMFATYCIIEANGLADTAPWSHVAEACLGFVAGMLALGALYASGSMQQIAKAKPRLRGKKNDEPTR